MEMWKKVWREGVAPLISTPQLLALERGLVSDDPRLVQKATTVPPPIQCVQDWPCEAGCLISYPFAFEDDTPIPEYYGKRDSKHHSNLSVGEVEEFFARIAYEVDLAIGEPAAIRWLLTWYDESPRDEVRSLLLGEVRLVLERRKQIL